MLAIQKSSGYPSPREPNENQCKMPCIDLCHRESAPENSESEHRHVLLGNDHPGHETNNAIRITLSFGIRNADEISPGLRTLSNSPKWPIYTGVVKYISHPLGEEARASNLRRKKRTSCTCCWSNRSQSDMTCALRTLSEATTVGIPSGLPR